MTPRSEALAYRIWGYADPKGWDVSVDEIAQALDVSVQRCGTIIGRKGWITRLRAGRSRIQQCGWMDAHGPDRLTDWSAS